MDNDGEICDRLVDTEPLQHICETENQVARVPKYKTNRGLIAQVSNNNNFFNILINKILL